MILVDSSIWVGHLRSGDAALGDALERGEVLMHPYVIGELACGNITKRNEVLKLLDELPKAPVATYAEALWFIESRALMGRGIGYVDAHLLASAALDGAARLWTLDRRLAGVAEELGLAHKG